MRYGLVNVMHHDDTPPRPMVPFYAALALSPDAPLAPAPRPRLQVPDERIAAACARHGIDAGRALVVFAPGAEFGQAKRWPPRHFGALTGLGVIMQELGEDKLALEAFRRALAVNPHLQKIPEFVKSLSEKVEGRDI